VAGACSTFDRRACGTACSATSSLPSGCTWTDTDGDGLNDTWETNGYIDNDCNGVNDCSPGPCVNDTPLPGANVNKPNVYVKWDYMTRSGTYSTSPTAAGEGCPATDGAHNHQPSAAAMNMVVSAFNTQNVILTFFPTHASVTEHSVTTLSRPTSIPPCAGSDAVSLYTIKAANFPTYLAPAYHYALFAHYNTCDVDGPGAAQCGGCGPDPTTGQSPSFSATGVSVIPGNDLIVSFGFDQECGSPADDMMNAGTFMHELGHTLGLHHGGSTDTAFGGFTDGDTQGKPNYTSVMNYNYQLGGIGTGTGCFASGITDPSTSYRVDYSREVLNTLSEGMLMTVGGALQCVNDASGGMDESIGVGGPTGDTDVVNFYAPGGAGKRFGGVHCRIDFDGDGDTGTTTGDTAVYSDVNGDNLCSVLHGYADWQHTNPATGVTVMQHLRTGFQCQTGPWAPGAPAPGALIASNELTATQALALGLYWPVRVDVRQARANHFVVPGGPGSVPVVAFGAPLFDATKALQASLRFAGAPAQTLTFSDVDGDGRLDLQATFRNADMILPLDATKAPLRGTLRGGLAFGGQAVVTVRAPH
jgi:hypothetical protein